jgi:flagellar biosynthesis protein FliR
LISFTLPQLDTWLATFFWPFIRILALLGAAPVLGHRSIPARVKVALALLVALIVGPTLATPAPAALTAAQPLSLLLQQLLVGLALGFSVTLIFAAVQLAGDLIGLQMGLSFASFVDPQSAAQEPIVGAVLNIICSLIFLAMDGHLLMVAAVVKSFSIVPIGPNIAGALDWRELLAWGTQIFTLGLQLALPALAALFLTNVALGVLTRSAPQLNLFAVGFPVTLLVGLVTLWLTIGHLGPFLERMLAQAWPGML